MKFAASLLLLLTALALLPSCTTLANRRDLYRPTEGHGYWTDKKAEYHRHEGILGISTPHHHDAGHEAGIFGVSHNRAEIP